MELKLQNYSNWFATGRVELVMFGIVAVKDFMLIIALCCRSYNQVPFEQLNSKCIRSAVINFNDNAHLEPKFCDKVVDYCNREKNAIAASTIAVVLHYIFTFGYTPSNLEVFTNTCIELLERFLVFLKFLFLKIYLGQYVPKNRFGVRHFLHQGPLNWKTRPPLICRFWSWGCQNSRYYYVITTLLLGHSSLAYHFGIFFFDIGGAISEFVAYYDAYATLPLEEVTRGKQERMGSMHTHMSDLSYKRLFFQNKEGICIQ